MEFKPKYDLRRLQDSENICDLLTEEERDYIGRKVCNAYEEDKQSRARWEDRMQESMELALQITKEKSYPWPNAANVKFPLLTIAALQFASRAYPALVKAPLVAKMRKTGEDATGKRAAQADRVSAHMSYQLLEQDEQWEEDQDKAFLALPIVGCIFKKSYYDPVKNHNCSKLTLPNDLVVHYYAKSIEQAERKTHVIQLYDRQIRERELRKIFTEIDYNREPLEERRQEDRRQGITPPADDEHRTRTFLEQHTYFDLDGDGYQEPYVVTVHKSSRKAVRIVARFASITTEQSIEIDELQKRMRALAETVQPPNPNAPPNPQQILQIRETEQQIQQMDARIRQLASEKPKVLSIDPLEYFTKYSFIPSPDGGFYDLGFGALLGPLNDSVNTLVNQLIDAGSLQNNGGGFMAKGIRIRGGKVQFRKNEWHRVDVAGGTLKDNIVPLPINPPSDVLFNMLSLLINYAERVASVNDAMVGENPGQNTPAYNYASMLEQGLQVFNGIFKRVYRAFRSELRKLYRLNSIYLDTMEYFEFLNTERQIARMDYQGETKALVPAADPNAFSNKEKLMKAQALAQRAQMSPGYDQIKVEQRLLEALDIPDSDEIFPVVQNPESGEIELKYKPAPNPEFEIKRAEEQRRTLEAQSRHELNSRELDGKMMVWEADVIVKLAQARDIGQQGEIKRLEMLLKDIQSRRDNLQKDMDSQRKALIEVAKIENEARNEGANNGMD